MNFDNDEQHITSLLREGKGTNNKSLHSPTASVPNPPQAIEPSNQENQPSPSSPSSTATSNSAPSPPTPTSVTAPSSCHHLYTAHPASPSRSPIPSPPYRTTAWEQRVLEQEQKRYSQRLKFALETQYKYTRNSDISTDLQGGLSNFYSSRMPQMGGSQQDATPRVCGVGSDCRRVEELEELEEYPFAWGRSEAERLGE